MNTLDDALERGKNARNVNEQEKQLSVGSARILAKRRIMVVVPARRAGGAGKRRC
jgi:hypothetical protein